VSTAPGGSRCHVVFLVRSFGFPHGMAATNRLRLLGRALLENGASVRVLCTRASEREGDVRNAEARGYADGIPFLYTTGSTVRSPSFVARRWREARGFVAALGELARLRRRGELDCAYLADLPQGWRPDAWLLRRWLGSLGVPVVAELNELPGEIDWLPRRAGSLPRSAAELPGARAWLPASLSRRLSPSRPGSPSGPAPRPSASRGRSR
jgi:hypothetical protein